MSGLITVGQHTISLDAMGLHTIQLEEVLGRYKWLNEKLIRIAPGWVWLLERFCMRVEGLCCEGAECKPVWLAVRDHLGRMVIDFDLNPRLSEKKKRRICKEAKMVSEESAWTCWECGLLAVAASIVKSGIYRRVYCQAHLNLLLENNPSDGRAVREKEIAEEPKVTEKGAEQLAVNAGPTLKIYDISKVERFFSSLSKRSGDKDVTARLEKLSASMISMGSERPYCKLPDDCEQVLANMLSNFPNFCEVISFYDNDLALARLNEARFTPRPILLLGPPGVGKTHFARTLANQIRTGYLEIHMENEQNGSALTGSSEFWSNTQTGAVFNLLVSGKTANPIIVVDELDKVASDHRYDPIAGLYQLLELETARKFVDLSVREIEIDASAIIWICTANDEASIPRPILNRLNVFDIEQPNAAQSVQIAKSIYRELRLANGWGREFEEEMSDGLAERLSSLEPRAIKSALISGFGMAARNKRRCIHVTDIPAPRDQAARRAAIGFVG